MKKDDGTRAPRVKTYVINARAGWCRPAML
jgi:hypothetical protein